MVSTQRLVREGAGRIVTAVAYLTDVEGMWSRVEAFAAANPLVRLEGTTLTVAPNALFVFGGDAVDRGPHSRRIIRSLLEVKRRQPSQVVLLAGNRDLNKLRLRRELTGHPPQKMPEEIRERSVADQLRWIFSYTMGAGGAFEHRREELGPGTNDDAVVESFLADVRDGGDHFEYLARCQLGFRQGRTLFVHGGLTDESFLCVPGKPPSASLEQWLVSLNGWYREQLDAVTSDAVDSDGRPLWTQLMAYQAPLPGTRLNQTSVVYGRTADPLNNPLLPPKSVRQQLNDEGVRRLVVGHTPNGDSPSILRAASFELVIADNSHARVSEGAKVLLDDDRTSVEAVTVLDDGGRHEVHFDVALDDERTPIGRRLKRTGELIKGRLRGGAYLLFRYLPEYRCEQRGASESEIGAEELVDPE